MKRSADQGAWLGAALAALALAAGGAAGAQPVPEGWRTQLDAAQEAGDPGRMLQVLTAAAEAGSSQAHVMLGDIYREGAIIEQDLAAAARWYEAAGPQSADGLNALGRMAFEGVGVPVDMDRAAELLGRAAALEENPRHAHDYALALEARGAPGDIELAAQWYQFAAAAGHDPAVTSLGVLYLEGRGVGADPGRAQALFEQAAEAGDARAQNNLGLVYARGGSVEQDYARAAELFRAAADQGLPQAMTNLAVLYENGFGVGLDEAEAVRLYRAGGTAERARFETLAEGLTAAWSTRLAAFDPSPEAAARDAAAAALGDPLGLYALGYRFANGAGRAVDHARAAAHYRRAAEAGFAPAALGLGVLYVRGLGVPQDYVEAYRHLAFAAAAGETGAGELRDALLARMGETQRAAALRAAAPPLQD